MKATVYLREYRTGKQLLLVMLRKAVQMGVKGFEGFRVMNNGEAEDDDWFISERVLNEGLANGTIVKIQ